MVEILILNIIKALIFTQEKKDCRRLWERHQSGL